jgi:hypothetical protein
MGRRLVTEKVLATPTLQPSWGMLRYAGPEGGNSVGLNRLKSGPRVRILLYTSEKKTNIYIAEGDQTDENQKLL